MMGFGSVAGLDQSRSPLPSSLPDGPVIKVCQRQTAPGIGFTYCHRNREWGAHRFRVSGQSMASSTDTVVTLALSVQSVSNTCWVIGLWPRPVKCEFSVRSVR